MHGIFHDMKFSFEETEDGYVIHVKGDKEKIKAKLEAMEAYRNYRKKLKLPESVSTVPVISFSIIYMITLKPSTRKNTVATLKKPRLSNGRDNYINRY